VNSVRLRNFFKATDVYYLFVILISLYFWSETSSMETHASIYPKIVLFLLIFFTTLAYLKDTFSKYSEQFKSAITWRNITVLLSIGLYLICIPTVGYFFTTYSYLFLFFQYTRFSKSQDYLENKTILVDSVISLCIILTIALIFKVILKLVFPEAWLF